MEIAERSIMMIEGHSTSENDFAHRFVRLLIEGNIAQELGPDGVWLLTVLVHAQRSGKYAGPAKLYEAELLRMLGFATVTRLARVRALAVASGWLHYESGDRRGAGKYWCLIPAEFEESDPFDPAENIAAGGMR